MFRKPADKVIFINPKIELEFNSLSEEDWLKKALQKAIDDFKENAFAGQRIKKKLIPKTYINNYNLDNLWWYPLPNAWRLVYSVITKEIGILVAIVEYFNHKDYERRFKY